MCENVCVCVCDRERRWRDRRKRANKEGRREQGGDMRCMSQAQTQEATTRRRAGQRPTAKGVDGETGMKEREREREEERERERECVWGRERRIKDGPSALFVVVGSTSERQSGKRGEQADGERERHRGGWERRKKEGEREKGEKEGVAERLRERERGMDRKKAKVIERKEKRALAADGRGDGEREGERKREERGRAETMIRSVSLSSSLSL